MTYLDFLLSNNIINKLISYQFDFTDSEIVDYFINFLKSISLKLKVMPI